MGLTQTLGTLTPAAAARWDAFVAGHPRASLYHHSRWVGFAADAAVEQQLMDAAATLARGTRVSILEIRDTEARLDCAVRTDKATLLLELPGTVDELSDRLGAKLRSQIRRTDRERPAVTEGGAELVAAFDRVFAETMPLDNRQWYLPLHAAMGRGSGAAVLVLPAGAQRTHGAGRAGTPGQHRARCVAPPARAVRDPPCRLIQRWTSLVAAPMR